MKQIGRYPVIDALGRGIMARVFLVRIPVIGRPAAAKCLMPIEPLPALLGPGVLYDRFVDEAAILGGLQHPHICEIFDFGDAHGTPFYLMAYHGHNLGIAIGEGVRIEAPTRTIRIDRAVEYILQTLSGLARLHDAGLVHRDIKPQNLLITDEDRIKIADFGLAKGRAESRSMPSQLKIGSPGYAAPEQLADPQGVDGRADLYAAAVVFYRLVTGHLPEATLHAGPPSLSRHAPGLDAEWDRFMHRALAPDPAQRFATAQQMGASLDDLAGRYRRDLEMTCGLPEVAPQSVSNPPSGRQRRVVPGKIRAREAQEAFGLDALWRPRRYWPIDRLHMEGDLMRDPWTGRLWQQAGSPYPLTWPEARAYVDRLNRQGFGGRRAWRLPTVDELVTLLRPPLKGRDFCIEPCFDQTQRRLWSADRKSYHSAWFVSPDLGFVAWQQTVARNWVRAVCEG